MAARCQPQGRTPPTPTTQQTAMACRRTRTAWAPAIAAAESKVTGLSGTWIGDEKGVARRAGVLNRGGPRGLGATIKPGRRVERR